MESQKYIKYSKYCKSCECGKNPIIQFKQIKVGGTQFVMVGVCCPASVYSLNIGHSNPITKSEFQEYSKTMTLDAINQWNISYE